MTKIPPGINLGGDSITNRFNYRMSGPDAGVGVGYELLEAGAFDPIEVSQIAELRAQSSAA